MKIETDIIASIATSPIVRVVIIMIRYVRTFKTNVIVGKVIMFDVTLTDNSNIKNIKSVCCYCQYHLLRSKEKCKNS